MANVSNRRTRNRGFRKDILQNWVSENSDQLVNQTNNPAELEKLLRKRTSQMGRQETKNEDDYIAEELFELLSTLSNNVAPFLVAACRNYDKGSEHGNPDLANFFLEFNDKLWTQKPGNMTEVLEINSWVRGNMNELKMNWICPVTQCTFNFPEYEESFQNIVNSIEMHQAEKMYEMLQQAGNDIFLISLLKCSKFIDSSVGLLAFGEQYYSDQSEVSFSKWMISNSGEIGSKLTNIDSVVDEFKNRCVIRIEDALKIKSMKSIEDKTRYLMSYLAKAGNKAIPHLLAACYDNPQCPIGNHLVELLDVPITTSKVSARAWIKANMKSLTSNTVGTRQILQQLMLTKIIAKADEERIINESEQIVVEKIIQYFIQEKVPLHQLISFIHQNSANVWTDTELHPWMNSIKQFADQYLNDAGIPVDFSVWMKNNKERFLSSVKHPGSIVDFLQKYKFLEPGAEQCITTRSKRRFTQDIYKSLGDCDVDVTPRIMAAFVESDNAPVARTLSMYLKTNMFPNTNYDDFLSNPSEKIINDLEEDIQKRKMQADNERMCSTVEDIRADMTELKKSHQLQLQTLREAVDKLCIVETREIQNLAEMQRRMAKLERLVVENQKTCCTIV